MNYVNNHDEYDIEDKKRSKKRGLSLMELMVTIAVIAVLATILFPVMNSVQNAARTTKSLSNLRQLATAIRMYASDNKGFYPPGYFNNPAVDPPERYWYIEIAEYINQLTISNDESSNILISPFVEKELELGDYSLSQGVETSPSTYSVHGIICPHIYGYGTDKGLLIWNLKENPSEIILLGEGTFHSSGYASATFTHPGTWHTPSTQTSEDLEKPLRIYSESEIDDGSALSFRANGSALVAFVDGHVEARRPETILRKNVVISLESAN